MIVRLSPEEFELAAIAGARRHVGARVRGLADRYGAEALDDAWGVHIEGTAAEMAVAKLLGRYYVPALHVQRAGVEGDVGAYQVRSTTRSDGCLLVKSGDRDEDVFILVVGRAPAFDVKGWIRGRDAKREEWSRAPNGRPAAFFVPQAELRQIEKRRAS